MGQRLQLRLFCEWAHRCLSHADLSVRQQVKVGQQYNIDLSVFVMFLPFFFSRLSWASVMFWQLIPISFMCVIAVPSARCFTLPAQNCRGRCWPSYACTSLLQSVRVTTVVRPQPDFTVLGSFDLYQAARLFSKSILRLIEDFICAV